ncbi:redoxin domain-containing protein [Clostridium botulinum]|uniref:cytochrome c biogenesis protein/redoxin n=1 Tax=Clostridium botulinum TaxID=1491 RepID=UPI0007748ED7|nr:cytochrome c biogenesis protein/redoxin [Clostridium botulinum]NFH80151.1 redoxin domain-containing protein [Clostridium botulinum]NFH81956.1 redoxin domain-containing protein [Clostridium botulinum]NFI09930.1 redoxin domain-containing protein [Clostridium botulinum]NFI15075.1 redoxin domain-containing protein [Clostridium botulinum]NFO84757.1 redoxin domain-containing protein [Clostridium botulinum]
MFEGISSLNNISYLLVFFEGIFSFLSPCVLPLIPLYIGYLAGNAKKKNADGTYVYERKKVLFHTIFFVLGISTAFFILGISFTAMGTFLNNNKMIFTKISGIIIIILGLFQIGFFEFKFLQRERKFNVNLNGKKVNPLIAYVMGFTFSFAWTPCVGPALSSVLILASSAKNFAVGNLLVLIYSLGFVIPFLILGMFTTEALNFLKKNKKIIKYTIKAGGALMIIMGIMTYTGWLNNVTGYLNQLGNDKTTEISSEEKEEIKREEQYIKESEERNNSNSTNSSNENIEKEPLQPSFDFTLKDQYGNVHKLSDYKGKTVFLNFWATWCPPCRMEMPHIEELYKEFNYNKDDIIILGVAQPGGEEKDIEGIKQFLNKQGYTFPIVFDESGEVFSDYRIMSMPTTFMINKDGDIYGYVSGALSKDQMKSIIEETKKN